MLLGGLLALDLLLLPLAGLALAALRAGTGSFPRDGGWSPGNLGRAGQKQSKQLFFLIETMVTVLIVLDGDLCVPTTFCIGSLKSNKSWRKISHDGVHSLTIKVRIHDFRFRVRQDCIIGVNCSWHRLGLHRICHLPTNTTWRWRRWQRLRMGDHDELQSTEWTGSGVNVA